MDFFDLHTHSFYSDGFLSPEDLIKKAKSFGFKKISLTDHNTIKGVDQAIDFGKKYGVQVIPGVEIYTHYKEFHLHILGYNFDYNNKDLLKTLSNLQKEKISSLKKLIALLKEKKWKINEKEIFSSPSSYPGIGIVASTLLKGKNFERVKKEVKIRPGQIFGISDLISFYYQSYFSLCPEAEIPSEQAIELIHQAKGKAVLAHPGQQLSRKHWFIVKELKEKGLDGLEAISGHHSWEKQDYWQRIAKEFNLFITAGSDYHGDLPKQWGLPINTLWQYFRFSLERFKDMPL